MYEYLLENLISYSQVDGNLRRTADRGLISELYRRQMNSLALKYFGVDSDGNYTENKEDIVAYRCPYSGEIISDLSTTHLEHILPVSSNGGTVLFNCIPILDKINLSKSDEPNVLVWWQKQNYFNYDRLERLIQYMLEAYTLAFKEPTEDELYDYDNSIVDDDYIENDDLSIDLNDKVSKKLNIHIQQNITYYQLISSLINELSKNRDVSKYNSQLNNLKEQNTFGNIDELEKVINVVQTVFKEALSEDSKRYLSYSLKIDMNKLLKSFATNNYEYEFRARLNYIINILKDNNKEILDYFESIQDIEENNILYNNNPTEEQINNFINNLKISHETKIKIFIKMLSIPKYTSYIDRIPDSNNIFSQSNKVSFEGYEHINGLNTSLFWKSNSNKIIETIYSQRKKLERKENKTQQDNEKLSKLNLALKAIDGYDFANKNYSQCRIEVFIKMLSNSKYTSYIDGIPDRNNIFSNYNKVSFEGYEHINGLNTSQFWNNNSNKIIETIYLQKKELERKENRIQQDNEKISELNLALKAIDDYNFANRINPQRRIETFIKMLSNSKYTSYIDGIPDRNNIFSNYNKVSFEGYEHINGLNTSLFWKSNSNKIIETIYSQRKKLERKENKTQQDNEKLSELNLALKAIDDYDFANKHNPQRRIEVFIKMLSNSKYTSYIDGVPDSNNIFARSNKVSFEGYEHINGLDTSLFWTHNSNKIIETIYLQKKELERKENKTQQDNEKLSELNSALKAIDDYAVANRINSQRRIETFIKMLSNSKYTSYINGVLDKNNIFSNYNKVNFEGYEHINGLDTSNFWKSNSNKFIIPLLFYNKIYDKKNKSYIDSNLDYSLSKYDSARSAVMEYLNYNRRKKKQPEFKTIDEYIDTLDKTKKEVKSLIELRDSLLLRKQQLSIENQELTEKLNTSVRRAM